VEGAQGQDDSEDDDDDSDDRSESAASGDEESDGDQEGNDVVPETVSGTGDTRRIRSFENMLSSSQGRRRNKRTVRPRKSISDRLASVSALTGSKVRLFLFDFMWISNLINGLVNRRRPLVHQGLLPFSSNRAQITIYGLDLRRARLPILLHHHHCYV